MRKLVVLCVAMTSILCLLGCAKVGEEKSFTYLISGVDQAASNTDVLGILRYSHTQNTITCLQIPRDTYFAFGKEQNKINQIYPTALSGDASPASQKKAMAHLTQSVSDAFGIQVDGYLSLSMADVARGVDAMGGIVLKLPCEVAYQDKHGIVHTLPKGEQKLTGEQAVAFVRHRAGYLTGDLGRIDAQKIFMFAFLEQVGQVRDIGKMLSIVSTLYEGALTNIPLATIFSHATHFLTHKKETDLYAMTLPGKAVQKEGKSGLWYYAVCKSEAKRVLAEYFATTAPFDAHEVMNAPHIQSVREVYHSPSCPTEIYHNEDCKHLDIKTPH
ncbi:MAG: LCP family protein [Clostridia bacterium]|nr:LCP family protein [Clostridia bacterium]